VVLSIGKIQFLQLTNFQFILSRYFAF